MKFIVATIFLCFSIVSHYAQNCGPRYLDSVFTTVNMQTVVFGQNYDYQGNLITLEADIYYPAGDTASHRAAIIYMHGGGFVQGIRNTPKIIRLCRKLAKKGYVVASIDYRLGVADNSNEEMGRAQVRAQQDLNAFIRYAKANAATAKIDTNHIFLSGGSAGGASILVKAFMDISELPAYVDTTGLGDLEGTSNLLHNSSDVFAVYALWGAVFDTLWIQSGDIPVGCVQSIYDPCIPWNSGLSCNVSGYTIYGANAIYQRAKNIGIPTTIHGYISSQHDLGLDSIPFQDSTIMFMSSFFYDLMCSEALSQSDLESDFQVLSLYPNPSTGYIKVEWPYAQNENVQLSIFTLSGQKVYASLLPISSMAVEINTHMLRPGIYILSFLSNTGRMYYARLNKMEAN
ncbi:MAG: alpha/beta hydrolase fold domain-containing protein [Candidatus Competibacteraceae bacterium]|nr:alpha/beta hydrolase fold domain-containing protein [Candidatus Competibacteraceae bacterium]